MIPDVGIARLHADGGAQDAGLAIVIREADDEGKPSYSTYAIVPAESGSWKTNHQSPVVQNPDVFVGTLLHVTDLVVSDKINQATQLKRSIRDAGAEPPKEIDDPRAEDVAKIWSPTLWIAARYIDITRTLGIETELILTDDGDFDYEGVAEHIDARFKAITQATGATPSDPLVVPFFDA